MGTLFDHCFINDKILKCTKKFDILNVCGVSSANN